MKVLEFAFDPNSLSDYLPHRIGENSICYAGTHDNNTLRGWIDEESAETLAFAREYLGIGENDDLAAAVLRARHEVESGAFRVSDAGCPWPGSRGAHKHSGNCRRQPGAGA